MSCDVGEATEGLENEIQAFSRFTYVIAHSPTLPSLYLRHSSFSNPSVALPTSQLILQTFRRFTYVTAHFPILLSLLLPHRIFTYVTWRAAHATPGVRATKHRTSHPTSSQCRGCWLAEQVAWSYKLHLEERNPI